MSILISRAYILHRHSYRDNSLLLEVFSHTQGRFRCIAQTVKVRGKIMRGYLEPFCYLQIEYTGTRELLTLQRVDECGRHHLSVPQLYIGYYFNELIMRLSHPLQQVDELFSAYKYSLHTLQSANTAAQQQQIIISFELALLENLGHSLCFSHVNHNGQAIEVEKNYYFIPDQGLVLTATSTINAISISGRLLMALQISLTTIPTVLLPELRKVLDYSIQYLLAGRPLYSRKWLNV
jgi:DNA repair protein RecO (recombination protein O)